MTTIRVRGASLAAELLTRDPSLTTWSRLESIPATGDLTPGLQAMIADPLWLLGRQWQFLEFNGEDAGSPIDVRVEVENAPIQRYRAGRLPDRDAADGARDYQSLEVPLEVMVEQEPVRRNHLRMRLEAGLHFLACLSAENAATAGRRYLKSEDFRLVIPQPPESAVDALGAALRDLAGDTAIDGELLAASFRKHVDESGVLTKLPRTPNIPAAQRPRVLRAARRWLEWYDSSVAEPGKDSDAWIPERLEYGLALSAELEAGPVVLVADEYSNGRLDWFSFRAAAGPSLGTMSEPASAVNELPAMIPSPVRYPGMPSSRYWEFEDRRVNLAQLDASRTDLTRLLLIEFGLAYGDDWFVVPVDLPVGSVTRIRRCVVRDTFGVETSVEASRNEDGSRWSFFQLATEKDAPAYLRDLIFLPPTLPSVLMSEPVEAVALGRDEMANLVWGTERAVQGVAGDRIDRFREASLDAMYQALPDPPPDASLIYRLASPVPRYQIPFVPVRTGDSPARATIRLERRALLRFLEGEDDPEIVHPRGLVLRSQPTKPVDKEPALQIEEEEVPREGVVVERAFQYTRWLDGKSFLWLGRRKRAGDGLASVGFVSDELQRKQ